LDHPPGLPVVMVTTVMVMVCSFGRHYSTSQHDERNDGKQNPLNLHGKSSWISTGLFLFAAYFFNTS